MFRVRDVPLTTARCTRSSCTPTRHSDVAHKQCLNKYNRASPIAVTRRAPISRPGENLPPLYNVIVRYRTVVSARRSREYYSRPDGESVHFPYIGSYRIVSYGRATPPRSDQMERNKVIGRYVTPSRETRGSEYLRSPRSEVYFRGGSIRRSSCLMSFNI